MPNPARRASVVFLAALATCVLCAGDAEAQPRSRGGVGAPVRASVTILPALDGASLTARLTPQLTPRFTGMRAPLGGPPATGRATLLTPASGAEGGRLATAPDDSAPLAHAVEAVGEGSRTRLRHVISVLY